MEKALNPQKNWQVYPAKQHNTPNGKGNKKGMGKTVFEGAFET